MHGFLSNLAYRQTDRQTNELGRVGEHIPPPLSEVNNNNRTHATICKAPQHGQSRYKGADSMLISSSNINEDQREMFACPCP